MRQVVKPYATLRFPLNDDSMAVNRMRYLSPQAEVRLAALRAKYDSQRRLAAFLRS